MANKKNPLKHIKVEVRPSPTALKILLTLLIVLSMGTLTALRWVHLEMQQEIGKLRSEAANVEYENEELANLASDAGTVRGIAAIAKRELGLVDPNTVLFDIG